MFDHPGKLILIGLALVIMGVVLPFLMILKIIESTFFWNFLAYSSSVAGLFLGLIGAVSFSKKGRN